jgi:predicted protein tyrosine phosphatase
MIIVCPFHAAQNLVDTHGASHVVSILDADHRPYRGIARENHLQLTFHDIVEPRDGYVHPQRSDAELLVAFLQRWNKRKPLLIHCWAGISRSTASAFTALCMLRPEESEEDLAQELREASPSATPNRLIVQYTDAILGRQGRMIRAIERIGRGADAFEGTPFMLAVERRTTAG